MADAISVEYFQQSLGCLLTFFRSADIFAGPFAPSRPSRLRCRTACGSILGLAFILFRLSAVAVVCHILLVISRQIDGPAAA